MKKSNILFLSMLPIILPIAGCNPDFIGSGKTNNSDYVNEKNNIKTMDLSEAEFENRIQTLQKKYGISSVDMVQGGNQPPIQKPKPCDSCEKSKSLLALPKAAVTYDVFAVKSASVPIERPYFEQFYVPAGQSISVTVTGTQSSVDPFLVIYEITSGTMYYASEQQLSVLAWNDDYSGTNSHATAGSFSTDKQVVVLAFAYDIYSKGQANVTIQIGGTTITRSNVAIDGTALFHDNSNNTFISKDGSVIQPLGSGGWTSYLPGTTAFVAADYNYWSGAYNWGSYKPSCSGDSYIWAFNLSGGRGMANDDSPDGYCSTLQSDASWTSFPTGWHYPNFVLLGGYSDGGQSNFLQLSAFQHQ